MLNVFDKTKKILTDSGVKKCFISANVEDVSEDNENLQKILSRLNLDEVLVFRLCSNCLVVCQLLSRTCNSSIRSLPPL